MPKWVATIDVRPYFSNKGDEHFESNRDGIVAALKRSTWYKNYEDAPGKPSLFICVDDLAQCEEVSDFDYYWDLLYVLADRDRVWIKTF